MDASLFSKLQATHVSAAHTVGTSLAPRAGATSNLRNAKTTADATTGGTTGTTSTTDTSSTTASGATITSDDFLTLLVSELKNQDPTQPTDPNEYISQLVGVNSLEQLIGINSGITSLDTAATSATSTGTGTTGTGTTGTGTGTGSSVASAVPSASSVPAIPSAPSQLHRPAAGTHLS